MKTKGRRGEKRKIQRGWRWKITGERRLAFPNSSAMSEEKAKHIFFCS